VRNLRLKRGLCNKANLSYESTSDCRLTFDGVIESRLLAACDAARHWRNGTAATLLVYVLAVYARAVASY
jgi:hypothetical protein